MEDTLPALFRHGTTVAIIIMEITLPALFDHCGHYCHGGNLAGSILSLWPLLSWRTPCRLYFTTASRWPLLSWRSSCRLYLITVAIIIMEITLLALFDHCGHYCHGGHLAGSISPPHHGSHYCHGGHLTGSISPRHHGGHYYYGGRLAGSVSP